MLEGRHSELFPAFNDAAGARDGGRLAFSAFGRASKVREISGQSSSPPLSVQKYAQGCPPNGQTVSYGDSGEIRHDDVNRGRPGCSSGHEIFGFMAPCWRLLERAQAHIQQARLTDYVPRLNALLLIMSLATSSRAFARSRSLLCCNVPNADSGCFVVIRMVSYESSTSKAFLSSVLRTEAQRSRK